MLISALMIGFSSAYASAATPVWLLRAKAGIAAAMMAANIAFEPLNAAGGQALANAIDPFQIVQTVNDTLWGDYIDQSVIVVRPDKITIDGEPYTELWLGSDAANSLRASGFDFTTAYNILSEQSEAISYASGSGTVGDIPIYQHGNEKYSPLYSGGQGIGSNSVYYFTGNATSTTPGNTSYYYTDDDSLLGEVGGRYYYGNRINVNSSNLPYVQQAYYIDPNTGNYLYVSAGFINRAHASYNPSPFEFDYTSGIIDQDPLPPEKGLLLRVPPSYDDGDPDSPYNYDIHDIVNTYPAVNDTNGHELVFDPSLNPDFDVDIDMGNALGDIITAVILAKLADLLGDNTEVVYAPMPEKDEPIDPGIIDPLPDPDPAPEDPTPGTTIADTDWTKLDEILRWIQSTIDSIRHLTESLQTMLDNIIEGINDIMQQIAEIPEAIRELADKILEDIELGPAKLFDKALDILKTLFLPLLLPIRAMLNLWHYVVEWIQSINTPFTWIFGIMSGTSGNMVLPIYALLAGGICISIYKALGR